MPHGERYTFNAFAPKFAPIYTLVERVSNLLKKKKKNIYP